MPQHKPVHPIFNNRWRPAIGFIAGILFCMLWNFATDTWRGFFDGTIYGKVVMENGNTSPQPVENIEISWSVGSDDKQCTPVFTNAEGEYRFEREVPIGHGLIMTAKYGKYGEIIEYVDGIKGVKWLFGFKRLGIPLSSGIPTQVDWTIPSIRAPTANSQ